MHFSLYLFKALFFLLYYSFVQIVYVIILFETIMQIAWISQDYGRNVNHERKSWFYN